jgi:hypothetical protein
MINLRAFSRFGAEGGVYAPQRFGAGRFLFRICRGGARYTRFFPEQACFLVYFSRYSCYNVDCDFVCICRRLFCGDAVSGKQ